MDEVARAFGSLLTQITEEFPEMGDILRQHRTGEMSGGDAMTEILRLVQDRPEVEQRLKAMAQRALAPLRDTTLASPPAEVPDMIFRSSTDGALRLNPLYEAALIERIQFDGDIPELRTGPMPEGITPAIPITTKARSPIAMGRMLENAAKRVKRQVETHQVDRRKAVEAIAAGKEDVLPLMEKHAALVNRPDVNLDVMAAGTPETDLTVYRRGQIPPPVKVRRPKGSFLAKMSPEHRREQAWRFLSTTQGRRSAVQVIRELLSVHFAGEGIEIIDQEYNPKGNAGTPMAHHEWTVTLSGAGATQAAFSLIDVAAKALFKGLCRELGDKRPSPLALEVIPVNQVDMRVVGWAARLLNV